MFKASGSRRSLPVAIAIVMALVFGTVSVYAIAAAPSGSSKIDKFAKKRKAVPFSHDQHIKAGFYPSCKKCHHNVDGEPKGDEAKCTTCHTEPAKDDKTLSAQKAFHKSCQPCHKKRAKAGELPSGPTKCDECHSG